MCIYRSFQILISGCLTPDTKYWILDSRFRMLDSGLRFMCMCAPRCCRCWPAQADGAALLWLCSILAMRIMFVRKYK